MTAYFPSSWVRVPGEFAPFGPADTYAILDDTFLRGSKTGVVDLVDMYAITPDRRKFGMTVVLVDGTGMYQLCNVAMGGVDNDVGNDANWLPVAFSGSSGAIVRENLVDWALEVGTFADNNGFVDTIALGSSSINTDNNQFLVDPATYGKVVMANLNIDYGLSWNIGDSGAGVYGSQSGARLNLSTGGQNTGILDNSAGTQFYAWGNAHAAGINPTGIYFDPANGEAALYQDDYNFVRHTTLDRLTVIGDADGKSGNGVQLYADDVNDDCGTRAATWNWNKGNTYFDGYVGANKIISGDVVAQHYEFGQNYPTDNRIVFDTGEFRYTNNNGDWIRYVEDAGNPSSGSLWLGNLGGSFNGLTLEINDNTTDINWRQAGQGWTDQCLGDSRRTKTQGGMVVYDMPTTQGALYDVQTTDGFGLASWDKVANLLRTTGAYKAFARNNAAPGLVSEVDYRDEPEAAFTGSITWTGTTAPSGLTAHRARFITQGSLTNFWVYLRYASPGVALTGVAIGPQTGAPTPASPTGLAAASNIQQTNISGRLSTSSLTAVVLATQQHVRRNATNTANEIFISAASAAYSTAWISGAYFS